MILNIQFISHRNKHLDLFFRLAPGNRTWGPTHLVHQVFLTFSYKEKIELNLQSEHNWNYCFESEFYVAFIELWALPDN